MSAVASPQPVAELYREHHGWLHGWLRRKLGCTYQAADLAQDTFVQALLAPSLDEIREPRAWLTTVARRIMANHLRRKELERAYLDAIASHPEPLAPGPEERALITEALCEIDALLAGLPARARQAFLLSQVEGLTYAEIARRLGVSLSMVKKYMLRATLHLAGIVKP
ncbi:sigma-70 family RNA polymerase sigma factor [Pseudothauera rhizosphaerae]|uniref:sigma-70 family RNA polymerase sigma factor n=1 Tax=Pseudothauera rhizosphaerae TaxID=2565932 RepID=UPI001B3B2A0A|nr:sigma-70 family RNA polymerase sigma factor [Pseudothauera rhizosphaerae]